MAHTTGKIIIMLNHLVQCKYCPKDVKNYVMTKKGKRKVTVNEVDEESGLADDSIGPTLHVEANPVKKQKPFTVISAKTISFGPDKQLVFEDQLLWAFISAGWSFNSITDAEW